ncbi:DUF58 domain-containing protein, partial [Bacteroidales bacterium OttesenSCG-928-I14]|nr:DUF58 domain-containing protein [Bacteroidales bacterium OttesenSCG-928-I14]
MFLNKRLYIVIIGVIVCFVAGFIHPTIFVLAKTLLIIVVCLCSYEFVRLFFGQKRISCTRECSDRFSNGDDNEIKLHLSNKYPFSVRLNIIDEVP